MTRLGGAARLDGDEASKFVDLKFLYFFYELIACELKCIRYLSFLDVPVKYCFNLLM